MEAGIDEAGRGPVVGPLVVGLVCGDPARLHRLGVKDSKLLSPQRRLELDAEIRRAADRIELVEVSAGAIDERMRRTTINDLEVDLFADLGRRVACDTYYLDACDVDADRFGRLFLRRLLRMPAPRVVSEHHADGRYPLVAAASIVAKVRRDAEVARIASTLEPDLGQPLGSGYAHDETTRAFIRAYLERFGRLPPETRTRWATARELNAARWQRRLPGLEPPPEA